MRPITSHPNKVRTSPELLLSGTRMGRLHETLGMPWQGGGWRPLARRSRHGPRPPPSREFCKGPTGGGLADLQKQGYAWTYLCVEI